MNPNTRSKNSRRQMVFNDGNSGLKRKTSNSSKLSQSLIKYSGGLIKNETTANFVLVGFLVVAIFIVTANFIAEEEIDEKYIFDPSAVSSEDYQ